MWHENCFSYRRGDFMVSRLVPVRKKANALSKVRQLSKKSTVGGLLNDIRGMIETARTHTAQAVNSALVILYWNIGRGIRQDVLKEKRADYSERIVATVSQQLGWSHFVEL